MSRKTFPREASALDWLTVVVLGGTFGATWAFYDRLPDPMPSHFGFSGAADGWMPRAIAAWLLPVATLALGALVRLGPWIMPRQWRPSFRVAPVGGIAFVLVTTLCVLHIFIVRAALTPAPRLGDATWVLVGVALIAMGQLIPRTGRNPLFGLRTKWAMASDENWKRAQRVGGRACTLAGAAMAILAALGHPILGFASLLLLGAWSAAWSWTVRRRDA